ncbi:acyl-CoA dehydrogenase family protein [Williamsia sp. 1135]|uniref:acyl-CoA dehydrogenase family protein n=1 Tax=Williamsia sp. 1135 TaxID=1889262 RepID=UPI001F0B5DF3|nr:acyl-CoA dehydrogenase family protein [Williamsia sp. 1135]
MDFTRDSTAETVSDVIDSVLQRHESIWDAALADVGGFETPLWASLAESGLLALPLPEASGGDDVAVGGLIPIPTALGHAAAVTPAIGTLIAGLAPLAQRAPELAAELGAKVQAGGWLATAISEPGAALTDTPHTSVSGGTLSGIKTGVLHAEGASAILVSADVGVVVVPADAPGVRITRTTSSSGWGEYAVAFTDVAADTIIDGDPTWLHQHHSLGLAAYADGLIAGAMKLTATHVSERIQFDKPIGTFQAVQQQLADIYVVARSMTLATTSAGWRLTEGLDAGTDLALSGYWLAQEIPATMRTMIHLHGGVGVDLTYPLHRYFSIAKDLARLVGGPTGRLDALAQQVEAGA